MNSWRLTRRGEALVAWVAVPLVTIAAAALCGALLWLVA